ncbi:legumain [Aplysia californica]|uniref:Legumain n=1 Tax=Aplysia californica TaxID=6500 RepID=A0ABM0K5R2_APLCA|nr:legumain [Aplysia californica]
MMPRHGVLSLLLLAVVLVVCVESGKNWVLLVSGAEGYINYNIQSCPCHAYHTMRNNSIPPENIVHMSYDDVAHDPENPIQGNLVTLPGGPNLYPGCEMDYRKKEVTPEVFLKVLTGDKEGVKKLIGRDGKVIDSGPDDRLFVYMMDHGGPGVFFFPGTNVKLHNTDLINALKQMHREKRYKEMVIYMEACHSGSMFDGLLPKNINIYTTTSANATEVAFMCCWDKFRKAYVGGIYDNAWLYDSDKANLHKETLYQQYVVTKKACEKPAYKSHPQQYGDLNMNKDVLAQFQAKSEKYIPSVCPNTQKTDGHIQGPEFTFAGIDLNNPALDMVQIATTARRLIESRDLSSQKREELKAELRHMMLVKEKAESLTKDLVKAAMPNSRGLTETDILTGKERVDNSECYKAALNFFSTRCPGINMRRYPFARRNLQAFINLCNHQSQIDVMNAILEVTEKYSICRAQ